MTRVRVLTQTAALLALISVLLLGACGGNDGAKAADKAKSAAPSGGSGVPVAGSFVGQLMPSDHAFVAIVAAEPAAGQQEREVRAYLCDAGDLMVWFRGMMSGNALNLTAANGTRLEATLTGGAATGTATLPDGRSLTLTAPAATGVSDLYTLRVGADGSFNGASERGGRVVGRVGSEGSGVPHDGTYAVTGTLTAADGAKQDFTVAAGTFQPRGGPEFEGIFIVFGTGSRTHIVGGTKGGKATDGGFWDPVCMLAR